jgi:hypothetical protein
MVWIKRSVETPRSPGIVARSLAGLTLGRPCRHADLEEASINNVQYPRISSKILKGASHEEVINDETDEILSILSVWSVETPRYPA